MPESLFREALRETASALRLNRPVLALVLAALAFAIVWAITGQPSWGALGALAAALVVFLPLLVWNVFAVFGKRFAALQGSVGEITGGQATPTTGDPVLDAEERERRKFIATARQMTSALNDSYETGGIGRSLEEALAQRSSLLSVFATLQKEFGVPAPDLAEANDETIELGRQFLKEVRPFITHGHVEQAQGAAVQFIARHQPGQIQEG